MQQSARLVFHALRFLFRARQLLPKLVFRLLGKRLIRHAGGLLRFLFTLQFLTGALQFFQHVLKAAAVARHIGLGTFDHGSGHTQLLRNGEGIGASRRSQNQTVGGLQGLHIELTARIAHTVGVQRIFLQFGIMRGRGAQAVQLAEFLQNGDGKRRTLHGVGARAKLIDENQCARLRTRQNAHDIDHVGGEGGEGLLDALLVPDIRPYSGEDTHAGIPPCGNVQTGLEHHGKQTQCFQSHGLAARVGSRDDHGIKVHPERHVHGNHRFRVEQRMTRPMQIDHGMILEHGRDGVHAV